MMQSTTTAMLSVLLLALASGEWDAPRSYPVEIERVKDGDTVLADVDLGLGVKLDDETIRLDGVDAPERYTPEGKAATAFTTNWIQEHQPLRFVPNSKRYREKYGRLFGRLQCRDGQTLNQGLLDAQHAQPATE